MITLPETNVICYIAGAFLMFFGIVSFFPNIASKIFKNTPNSRKAQVSGAVTCLVLGIALLILGFTVFQNG